MEVELDLDNLTVVRVLGQGAMGTVFLVTDRSAHPSFALKVFDKRSSAAARPDADRRARWEISILRRLRHPFLPSLLGAGETPDLLAWGLPFCHGGDLHSLRRSLPDGVLSAAAVRFYLSELVSALQHLHSLGIVYRDLKPENVLLRCDGHLVLTDFDLSRNLSPPSPPQKPSPPITSAAPRRHRNLTQIFHLGADWPAHQLKKAKSARVSPVSRRRTSNFDGGERSHSFVGTEEYVAPEVVRGEGHEFAVDWWALGILAYELAHGRTPFKGRNRKETFGNVLTRQPSFAGGQPSDLTDLIRRLLEKDPRRRLGYAGGAEEVRAHPFLAGVKWELLAEVARPPFLSSEEAETVAEGVSVSQYFERMRQLASPSPGTSSASMSEF